MSLAQTLLGYLKEMAWTRSTYVVDYTVTSPKGNKSRFNRREQLGNMYGSPQSETAVLSHLRTFHPGVKDIQINTLKFV